MELAAVFVVPSVADPGIHVFQPQRPAPHLSSSIPPVLGNDILQTWFDHVHKLAIRTFCLTPSMHQRGEVRSALGKLVRDGIERLLMIKLNAYAEMDLTYLLRFHSQKHNSVTIVRDSRGQLGVSVFDSLAFPSSGDEGCGLWSSSDGTPIPYQFSGYAKRISSASERQELVKDSLRGKCALRPLGTEIREQVWVGTDARMADSARFLGPTYVGDRTAIQAGAIIGPFASVERDCVVDCGTTVEHSTILPCTHVAQGLLVRNSVVDGGSFENLQFGIVADMQRAGLARRAERPRLLPRIFGSLAGSPLPAMETGWVVPQEPEYKRAQP